MGRCDSPKHAGSGECTWLGLGEVGDRSDAICSVGFLLAAAEALSPWHSALALLVLSFHDSVDAPEVMRR